MFFSQSLGSQENEKVKVNADNWVSLATAHFDMKSHVVTLLGSSAQAIVSSSYSSMLKSSGKATQIVGK